MIVLTGCGLDLLVFQIQAVHIAQRRPSPAQVRTNDEENFIQPDG
jgi:hypothetical protein